MPRRPIPRLRPLLALLLFAAAPACAARAPLPALDRPREYATVGALELSGVVERDGEAVYSMVEIMNTGSDTVRLAHPEACGVSLILLSTDSATLRWDLERWGQGQGYCSGRVSTMDLPPNTLARLFSPIVGEPDVRGDSLPGGDYASAMRIRLVEPADTTILLWSGPVRLGELDGLRQISMGPKRKLPPAEGSSLSRNSSTACVISARVMRPSSSRSACAKKESAPAASTPQTSR